MADFRKLSKDNPLKPSRVAIPQLDPLTAISDTQEIEQRPEVQASKPTTVQKPKPTKPTKPTSTPEPEPDDLAAYKNKYLHKEEEKVTKTFRMYKWRYEQLDKEVRDTGLNHWQIIDIGLEMYFRDKQKDK